MIPLPHNEETISTFAISSSLGHYGEGILPFTLLSDYRVMRQAALETKTTMFGKSMTPEGKIGFVKHPDLRRPWTIIQWIYTARKYVKSFPDGGKLNAYGLTNDGPDKISKRAAKYFRKGYKVILNIFPEFADKPLDVAIDNVIRAIEICGDNIGWEYFTTLEQSYSCPNSVKENIACNMRDSLACAEALRKRFPWLNMIAKTSIVHPYEYLQEMQKHVDVLHFLNTVPFAIAFPGKASRIPVAGGGGYSGPAAEEMVFNYNKEARKKLYLPVVMGNSVRNADHVQRYLDIGADSVSSCAMAIDNSAETEKIIYRFNG